MASFSAFDHQMMAKAIELARRGRFTTTPNPNVGCVITDSANHIVGQGWHQKSGGPHAEVFALQQAAEKAKGATAYVTLEPCSHHGRTPPCSEALIKAGVKRVVVAMTDPNPKVAGRGLNMLAEAGVEVSSGLMEAQSETLNPGFLKRMRTGLPYVRVKLASSLDGKTALANGESQWISGPEARQDVQRHRAQSCAILSGSGTVLADNPSLNVRYSELGYLADTLTEAQLRQPLRIIIDGKNRVSPELKLFSLPGDVLLINQQHHGADFGDAVSQWQAPVTDGFCDLNALVQHLGQLHLNDIWVEAGSHLAGALLQQQLVDELILYQAPQLLGDKGRDLLTLPELTSMQQAILLDVQDMRQVGRDVKITAKPQYR